MANRNVIDQIKSRADIIEVISKRVTLKKQGAEWVGLCPFHNDNNPSMFVSKRKQLYKCFSCGAGGDVFQFVMEFNKLNFKDAAKYLAELCNIVLPERFSLKKAQHIDFLLPMKIVNAWVSEQYHRYLFSAQGGELARQYIKKRRLSKNVLQVFKVGYSPNLKEFLLRSINEKQPFGEMKWKRSTLFIKTPYGMKEFFRNRIMFPIANEKNEILGFGGRTIAQEEPKYLNVRESNLFRKREILYGFKESYDRMIKTKHVYVVEGYLDVIGCYEVGIPAVAPLGTALTKEHLTKLKRYVEKVHLLFDGDESGKKAAWRSAEIMVNLSMDGLVYSLPDGEDPFDFVKKRSAKEIESFLTNGGIDVYRYLIHAVKDGKTNWSPVEKKQALDKLIPIYKSVQDSIVKQNFADLINKAFSIDLSTWQEGSSNNTTLTTENIVRSESPSLSSLVRKERNFVLFLCNHVEFVRSARMVINLEKMEDSLAKYIFKQLLEIGEGTSFQQILDMFKVNGQEKVANYIFHESLKTDYRIAKNQEQSSEKISSDVPEANVEQKLQTEFNERVVILKNEYLRKQKDLLSVKIKAAQENNEWEKERDFYEQFTALKLEEDKLQQFLNS